MAFLHFCDWQVSVRVPIHQLVKQSVGVWCGNSTSQFWRCGHCGYGGVCATLGDGNGYSPAITDGMEKYDWGRGWQTCTGNFTFLFEKSSCDAYWILVLFFWVDWGINRNTCTLLFLSTPLRGTATLNITTVNKDWTECHSAYLPHSCRTHWLYFWCYAQLNSWWLFPRVGVWMDGYCAGDVMA